jgi:hypothetical protein
MTPDTLATLIAYMLGCLVLGLAIGILYDNITKEWSAQ